MGACYSRFGACSSSLRAVNDEPVRPLDQLHPKSGFHRARIAGKIWRSFKAIAGNSFSDGITAFHRRAPIPS